MTMAPAFPRTPRKEMSDRMNPIAKNKPPKILNPQIEAPVPSSTH